MRSPNNTIPPKGVATVRLILLANKAAPSPILGQAFGQYGINIMEFCNSFNKQTKNIVAADATTGATIYIPTTVTIFSNGTFQVQIKTPTTTGLLKNTARFEKGSATAGVVSQTSSVAKITPKEVYHIGAFKKCDRVLNSLPLKSICKTIIGSAKSMGLQCSAPGTGSH